MIRHLGDLEKLDLQNNNFTVNQAIELFRELANTCSLYTLKEVNLENSVNLGEIESDECAEDNDFFEFFVEFLTDAESLTFINIMYNKEKCETIKERLLASMETD